MPTITRHLVAKTKLKYHHKEDFLRTLSVCSVISLLCLSDSISFCERKSNETENCVMHWSPVRLDFMYNFLNPFCLHTMKFGGNISTEKRDFYKNGS